MKIVVRGEEVYKCDVCNRKKRISNNVYNVGVLPRCVITDNCVGRLHKVTNNSEISSTPAIIPEVPNVKDWFPRKLIHNHNQYIPASEWLINHNLGNDPTFDVLVNLGNTTVASFPTQQLIDKNTTKLIFDRPCSGTAQAVSLSKTTNTDIIDYIPTTRERVQFTSNSGLLTFATLSDNLTLDIELTFKTRLGTFISLTYTSKTDDKRSPWTNVSTIYINQKTYTVRTIDVVFDADNIHFFKNGDIPNTSDFVISRLYAKNNKERTMIDITYDTIAILLSNYPHEVPDRNMNEVMFANPEIFSQAFTNEYFSLDNGEAFANAKNLVSIYPTITIVQ